MFYRVSCIPGMADRHGSRVRCYANLTIGDPIDVVTQMKESKAANRPHQPSNSNTWRNYN